MAEPGARLLHHLWLSPFCRKVRVCLAEKGLDFTLRTEKVWERRPEFLVLNPAGEVPVLIEPDGTIIADSDAICAYLDEAYGDPQRPLFGSTPLIGAEARRLVAWFDRKFDREVTQHLVEQKIMKRFLGLGEPDSGAIRAGKANIRTHLDYVGYLTDRRKWLAGDEFTLADIAAAAHLSTIDYLGDVAWEDYPVAKDWYARIKSRPSFRAILTDSIPGAPPPKHYADLDF
ncbi:MAG: glutathione S-transferase family protein [Alphaproteobacteria bacterium]|nr:glutathione S-transferase family protein [Alphaproteobacteria bacterium]